MVELETEPEIWVPVPQTKFVGRVAQIIQWFLVFNGANRSQSQKLPDVGAGARKF